MQLNGNQKHKKLAWIVTGAVIALGILIGALSPKSASTTQIADPAPSVEAEPAAIEEPAEEAVADEAPEGKTEEEAPVAAEEAEAGVPAEYTCGLTSAETYSDMMHMSKAGIFDQLTSEYGGQLTSSQADYAIDHLND